MRPLPADDRRDQHGVAQAGHRKQLGNSLQEPDDPGFCVRQMRHASPSLPTPEPSGNQKTIDPERALVPALVDMFMRPWAYAAGGDPPGRPSSAPGHATALPA